MFYQNLSHKVWKFYHHRRIEESLGLKEGRFRGFCFESIKMSIFSAEFELLINFEVKGANRSIIRFFSLNFLK